MCLTLAPNPRPSTARTTSRAPLPPLPPPPASNEDGSLPPPCKVILARPVVTLTEHEVTPGRAITARSTCLVVSCWVFSRQKYTSRWRHQRHKGGEERGGHVRSGKRGAESWLCIQENVSPQRTPRVAEEPAPLLHVESICGNRLVVLPFRCRRCTTFR